MIKSWNKTAISWKNISTAIALFGLLGVGIACTETNLDEDIASTHHTTVEVENTGSGRVDVVEIAAPPAPAQLKGGFQALVDGLTENLKYPQKAVDAGVEGKVFISFTVNKDGSASNYKIVKGIGYGCDEAALEALKASKLQWDPAVKEGKFVSQEMTLPVSFQLPKE